MTALKPPRPFAADTFVDNLLAGVRLAFALPVAPGSFRSDRRQLIALGCVVALILVLFARLSAGAASLPWTWGISTLAAQALVWLLLVGLACIIGSREADPWPLVVAIVCAWLPAAATIGAIDTIAEALDVHVRGDSAKLHRLAVMTWHAAIVWRALALLPRPRLLRRVAASACYLGGLVLALSVLPSAPMFYQPQTAGPALDVEAVYYRQQTLIERQLARLPPERPGEIDIYMLAYAPYAEQDVFLHEARSAIDVAERSLGLDGRHVELISHRSLVERVPLANRPNLEAALHGLADVMNPAEDIVFVFLTSHGGDGGLAAAFGELAPNDLWADELRAALDAAGLRWRMVVVSACYSGSFIAPLATPASLVVTAAAADRASFGCTHENTWTYFGEAYFAGGLSATGDPVSAFERALTAVRQRERDEGLPASRPQMVLGAALAARLAAWRQRRPPLTAAAPATPPTTTPRACAQAEC